MAEVAFTVVLSLPDGSVPAKIAPLLHDLLAKAEYEVVKVEEAPKTGLDLSLARAHGRIQELFTRVAPKGVTPHPALVKEVHGEVCQIFKEELIAGGMAESGAAAISSLLALTTHIKVAK